MAALIGNVAEWNVLVKRPEWTFSPLLEKTD